MQRSFMALVLCAALGAFGCGSGGGGGGNDGGEPDGGDADGGGDFNVSGRVGAVNAEGGEGGSLLEGATVSVMGTNISTVTDVNGAYTLTGVGGGMQFLKVDADDHWSAIGGLEVSADVTGVDIEVVPDELVAFVAGELGRNVATIEANAIVGAEFEFGDENGSRGGESASLDVASDEPFVTSDGFPEAEELPEGVDDGLIFTGIDPDDGPVTVTFSGADGLNDCVAEFPGVAWPVAAKAITEVHATCTDL